MEGEGVPSLPPEGRLGQVFASLSCDLRERGLEESSPVLNFRPDFFFFKSEFIPAAPNPVWPLL